MRRKCRSMRVSKTGQEKHECPLGVRLTFRVQKQLFWQGGLQFALEVTPSVYFSIVHPHQSTKAPGMTVVLTRGSRHRRSSHMSKDQRATNLLRESGQIGVAPCWCDRLEDAWSLSLLEAFAMIHLIIFLQQQRFLAAPILIPAHSKAIRVEGTGGFEAQPALVGLVCNTVYRPCDQMTELDWLFAGVDEEATHGEM